MARSMATARKKNPSTNKRDADGWVRRGQKHDRAGDQKKAMKCYLHAFDEDPTNLTALKLLSRKLMALTERQMAVEVLERAVKANPNDIEVYLILGNLALEMRMLDGALTLFNLVCQIDPEEPAGPNNVATTLRDMERYDEAIGVLQDAIGRFPTAAALWITLATIVAARDGIPSALPFYEEALRLDPKHANAWSNLAKAYDTVGRFEDAIEAGRKAIALDPEHTEAHFITSMALLALGHLTEGWKENDWRLHWRRSASMRYVLDCERWNGEPLDGKSLLVCPEQGVGDEILFATCIPDVAALSEQLYIGCDKRLVPLFERSFPGAIVGAYRDFFSNAQRCRDLPFIRQQNLTPDLYIEAGSLFQHVRKDISDFPERKDGFLVPDPERVEHWKRELEAMGSGLKIGISWESMLRNNERNKFYASLDQWKDVLTVEGATFVNMQHGDVEDQLKEVEDAFNVTIHRPQGIDLRNDLDDLAALARAVDIMICPTIANSCLSLAVGTELWLLAPRLPWWHLGRSGPGESTPIGLDRLFLFDEQDGWEAPMRAISEALRERV